MNIIIRNSSYKNLQNKNMVIFDCISKNYRKKIKTGFYIDKEIKLTNDVDQIEKFNLSILDKNVLKKIYEIKELALLNHHAYNWSLKTLENFLKSNMYITTIDGYVVGQFSKNKSTVTLNDYKNVVKAFKKHLGKGNIFFEDVLNPENIKKFKVNAMTNGVKESSVSSYIKKMAIILKNAFEDGLVSKRINIPKFIIKRNVKDTEQLNFDKKEFIYAINKSNSISEVQSLTVFLLLSVCGGMNPSNIINYYNDKKNKLNLIGSMIYENNFSYMRFLSSKKGNNYKYVKINKSIERLVEITKTLFYITHYKKYSFILASYTEKNKVFNFDINKYNNLYRNTWNILQKNLKLNYNYKFSNAKPLYENILQEIEMKKFVSDIMFGKISEGRILGFRGDVPEIKGELEMAQIKLQRKFWLDELLEIINNKLKFLHLDISQCSINKSTTPANHRRFLSQISMIRAN